jgi:hypothetical protein
MLLSGKEKVGAEIALLFLGYNLTRAINMPGVQGLIAQMSLLLPFPFCFFSFFCLFSDSRSFLFFHLSFFSPILTLSGPRVYFTLVLFVGRLE